jgi:hypothetical protein
MGGIVGSDAMGRVRKVVGWALVIYGVAGTLDRLGYFPTAWFPNPVTKVVEFLSANSVLYFLYLVFPPVMLALGLILLLLEHARSKGRHGT